MKIHRQETRSLPLPDRIYNLLREEGALDPVQISARLNADLGLVKASLLILEGEGTAARYPDPGQSINAPPEAIPWGLPRINIGSLLR